MPRACAVCGPRLYLTDENGRQLESGDDAISHARGLLSQGQILAVKGVGGFHLVCDAANTKFLIRYGDTISFTLGCVAPANGTPFVRLHV